MSERGEPLGREKRLKATLPDNMPARGAGAHDLLDWANGAAARAHNPIVAVRRYGFDLDARLELEFEHGERVKVRQRELMGANGLRHVLSAFDGGELPGYNTEQVGRIVNRLIWASEANVRDDDLEALLDDVGAFLQRSLAEGLYRRDYSRDGAAMLADYTEHNRGRSGERAEPFPITALDTSADPPVLWVPRPGLLGFLRDRKARIDPTDLRAHLESVGWQFVDFHRRLKSGPRPKARIWVLPADWERCPFDLLAAVEAAVEFVPSTPARASS
jgi:hypothetical protein